MLRNHNFIFAVLTFVLVLSGQSYVFAQNVPSSAESSRINQSLPKLSLPAPDVEAPTKKQSLPETAIPENANEYEFMLQKVNLKNMTVYKYDEIQSIFGDLIGKKVTFANALKIADKITVKYRNDGYVLSRAVVPPQKIEGGAININIIEGFIDQINIDGDIKKSKSLIKSYLHPVKDDKPLNMKTLERALLLINDLSGVSARNVLSPSTMVKGAADLKLIVEEKKDITSFIQIDNRGTRYLGPAQTSTAVQFDNYLKRNETVNVQMLTTPAVNERELDYISMGYSEKIGRFGTLFAVNGSITATKPGFELSSFDVKGRSESISVSLKQPIIRSRTTNLNTSFKLDISNTKRKDNLSAVKIKDKMRVARLNIDGQYFDRFSGVTSGSIEVSKGIDALGTRKTGSANLTRARGVSDFFKTTAELSRTQRIKDNLQLVASIKGQKSANILLSSEEFGVGGSEYGKAYDGSEITGEDGFAGKLELHLYNPYKIDFVNSYQFYTWYDAGIVWDRDNAIVKDKKRSLASAGFGLQSELNDKFSIMAELGFPLTRNIEVEDNTNPRLFVTLFAKF